MELCWSGYLLPEEIGDDLHAVFAPIHVVAKEKKVGGNEIWAHPPEHLLETDEVREVAVKIAC